MPAVNGAKVKLGVDPLGGAGVHCWARIAEHYRLDLTVGGDRLPVAQPAAVAGARSEEGKR